MQQKLSLFQCLNSTPSRAVEMEEIVRLIRYDNDVKYKTESYRKMASVLGKEKADEEVKRKMVPACSVGVLFDGNGRGAGNVLGFTGLALCDIDHIAHPLPLPKGTAHPLPLPKGGGSGYFGGGDASGGTGYFGGGDASGGTGYFGGGDAHGGTGYFGGGDALGGSDYPGGGDASGGTDYPGGGDALGGSGYLGGGDALGGSDYPGGGDALGGSDYPGGGDAFGGSDYPGGGDALREAFERAKADPHTLLVYRTISGKGLRIIYRYTRGVTAEELTNPPSLGEGKGVGFSAAFLHGNRYYAELLGHEYDAQCSDYSRLCGLAHDEQVYVNWEAEPFVITDDEILAANFSADNERGKQRREYAAGTHEVSVEEAWPRVEKALAGRGLVYQSGHHHDYVMHAAFLMNRYGVDLDELLQWASQEWGDYNSKERESTIRSCYKKTQEHGTWRLTRQGRKAKETSMITLPEIKEWLRQKVEVIYNVVTDQLMYMPTPCPSPREGGLYSSALETIQTPLPWGGAGGGLVGGGFVGGLPLDERVVCSIRSQMAADTGKRVLKNDVMDVLRSDFARLYHPVREYIEALPAWDGKDRVKELCSHVKTDPQEPTPNPSPREGSLYTSSLTMPQQGNQAPLPWGGDGGGLVGDGGGLVGDGGGLDGLFPWALHKWLVAMVATWMSDHSCNHEIFVLIGPQGIYKTTFFRHLLPPQLRMYFWENAHNSFSSKDDHLALAENCLVEIEEIDLQNPRDISELKALATSEKVKERRPYARFREEKHRLASFCGSGNQQRFLNDDTGNRRWLCFMVTHIDDPRTWALDYDQLYAQLRDELRQGFRYWFDPQEQRIVERHNQAFRIESDEEQLIRSRLRPPGPGDKVTLMNAASICQFINGGMVGRGLSTRKVGIVMGKMGFKKIHTMRGWFYEVYQIPPNEIQPTLAETDEQTEDNGETSLRFEEASLPF